MVAIRVQLESFLVAVHEGHLPCVQERATLHDLEKN